VEWFGDFDYLKSKGWSSDAAVNFMLNNHVSVIDDNFGRVPPEAMPQLEKLARLASYRFVLREVAHDKTVPRGAALDVPGRYFPPRRLVEFPLLYPYLLAPQKTPPSGLLRRRYATVGRDFRRFTRKPNPQEIPRLQNPPLPLRLRSYPRSGRSGINVHFPVSEKKWRFSG
jgi:hypothetical protein